MRLATPFHRGLVSLGLIGGLALLAATQGEAANGRDAQRRPVASCPVQGGADASPALAGADTAREAQDPAAGSSVRRIDWRAMLPAVNLRIRA